MGGALRSGNGLWSEAKTRQLIELRKHGISNSEIAVILDLAQHDVQDQIGRLVWRGMITTRKGLLTSRTDSYVEGRERTVQEVEADVAQLYAQNRSHREIGDALTLTTHQVHNILTGLFVAGLPKRGLLTEQQVRAVYAAYQAGASIDSESHKIGFTGSAVRQHMHKLGLPTKRGQCGSN